MYRLIIGNKNYSSWSLRAWLLLKEFQIPFEELRVPLHTDTFKQEILHYSRAGKVPALVVEGLTIWDSLAICEYIAESYPEKNCWPERSEARAIARSVSNEMHSGFPEIRSLLPMNCRKQIEITDIPQPLQVEIDRIREIWKTCRENYGAEGAFLFGRFSIADAMFAPVVLRFRSYAIHVGEEEQRYMNAVLSLQTLQQWLGDAAMESEVLADYEIGP